MMKRKVVSITMQLKNQNTHCVKSSRKRIYQLSVLQLSHPCFGGQASTRPLLSTYLCAMIEILYGCALISTFLHDTVWMAIFMEVLVDPPIQHGFWINAFALLFGIILPLPLTGILSDHIGRDKTMSIGVAGLAVLGPIMVKIISSGQPVKAFFAQLVLGLFLSLFGGPMNAWLVEKFRKCRSLIFAILTFSS